MLNKKIVFLILPLTLICFGCAFGVLDRRFEEIVYSDGKLQKYSYYDESYGSSKGDSSVFLDAIEIIKRSDSGALPELDDLPFPKPQRREPEQVRSYVGIIKNNTNHQVFIPSKNSQGTITVPAKGWVEFVVWKPRFEFTAYRDGKPISCFSISVRPGGYDFMCDRYDFMAIIGVEEPIAVPGLG
jgi:hypothetical protein